MSTKTIGRIIGALYLVAFVVYIAGGELVTAGSASLPDVASHQRQIAGGALLMLLNSVAVVLNGVIAFPVVRSRHEISAYGYLVSRTIEGVVLAVGILFLLLLIPLAQQYTSTGDSALPALAQITKDANDYAYQIGMLAVCLAGLIFSRVLLRARLVPAFLAVWGLAGYAVFLAGTILEVLGFGAGLVLSIPGGLFEVALGVWLLAKGFEIPNTQVSVETKAGA